MSPELAALRAAMAQVRHAFGTIHVRGPFRLYLATPMDGVRLLSVLDHEHVAYVEMGLTPTVDGNSGAAVRQVTVDDFIIGWPVRALALPGGGTVYV